MIVLPYSLRYLWGMPWCASMACRVRLYTRRAYGRKSSAGVRASVDSAGTGIAPQNNQTLYGQNNQMVVRFTTTSE